MSGGILPELGSKISLISKADIRYEGRLYTVDPSECTIALSSVRSFGTEDRETQFQIAPQSQIYDYILFRGSDIKDIRVVNNSLPHPHDPAIMKVLLPSEQHLLPHFTMPMNAPHAPPMGAAGYQFGGMGALGGMTAAGTGASPSLAPGAGAPGAPFMLGGNQQQQQQQSQQQQSQKQPISVIDMLAGASRSTTPVSLISRKSPTADNMAMSANQQQQHHQQQSHNNQQRHSNQNIEREIVYGGKRQNHQQQSQIHRGSNNNNNQRNGDDDDDEIILNIIKPVRRESGRNMDNYNNQQHHDGRNNYNNQRNQRSGRGGGRTWPMPRGPHDPTVPMMRSRGGGSGGGRGRMQNQNYRPMILGPAGNQNKPRNPKNAIKFDQDFDFEQANNKFEELRSQLVKLKVGDEPKSEQCTTPTPPSQMNGETDKKDDSGNETGAGEHEPEDEEITVGYDKTKSFFDNISCEAAQDRSKNKKNDWRHERKLNSETFGASSTWRGGYRGRGGFYNRNSFIGGGGYNRGYRGGNNYRNNNRNMRMGGNGREHMNSNANRNHNNTAGNLKNQAQQQQHTPATAADATTGAASAVKSTPLEISTQPQVAAVGGQ